MSPVLAAALLMLPSGASAADVVSLPATRDATLYEFPTGAIANGSGEHFFAGSTGTGFSRRGLLAFDPSAIPAGSQITGVTLRLHMSRTASGEQSMTLHAAQADWGEGTSNAGGNEGAGAAAQPGDATWLHTFAFDQFWSTPGGDFDATPSAATTIGFDTGFYEWSGAGMVDDVQAWLDAPASNFGWFMLGNEVVDGTTKRFDSRTNANAALRPQLIVEFIVPAPASAVLIGLGGLAVRRRR